MATTWITERGDRVETYRAGDGWRWRVVAANGERLEQGEAHTRPDDAARAAERYHPPRPAVRPAEDGSEAEDPLGVRRRLPVERPLPRTASAGIHPCQLYAHTHSPEPVRTQFHHSKPVYLQNRVYGRILYPADTWLCGLCHDAVHEVIDWLLGEGREPSPMPGRQTLAEARRTFTWYQQAVEHETAGAPPV